MNLVIDDAVEVKQATKTDGESRRSLGMARNAISRECGTNALQAKYSLREIMCR